MRIWRHSCQSTLTRQLIVSPDTDVYIIGVTQWSSSKDIYIEISTLGSKEKKLLHLSHLHDSLTQDPDLAAIPQHQVPLVIQTLYASTGCDYTSFFSRLGKSSFLKAFYRFAEFIGSVNPHSEKDGYFSFLRLVGSAYYLKYRSSFTDHHHPRVLYHSFDREGQTVLHQHVAWLDSIRAVVWQQTQDEKDFIPSHTALQQHWLRACWVLNMWNHAANNKIQFLPIDKHGWKELENGQGWKFLWDTEEHILSVRTRVNQLTRGCKCKKGCHGRCGCRQKGQYCGAGCKCMNCSNLNAPASGSETHAHPLSKLNSRGNGMSPVETDHI